MDAGSEEKNHNFRHPLPRPGDWHHFTCCNPIAKAETPTLPTRQSIAQWPSRDPIGEVGGVNLYAYVENEAVNKIDASGLQASGCCGPDVTIPTQTTLNDIEATFKRWTVGQKLNACRSLYFPLSTARGAWFMLELANLGAGQWDFPTPPAVRGGGAAGCDTTVKYGGRCFFAGDVHYLMWGKINNLCYQSFHGTAVIVSPFFDPLWSLDLALYAVDVWKNQMHHDPPEYAQGAKLFTTIGYNGS